jgi:hypothetical protein
MENERWGQPPLGRGTRRAAPSSAAAPPPGKAAVDGGRHAPTSERHREVAAVVDQVPEVRRQLPRALHLRGATTANGVWPRSRQASLSAAPLLGRQRVGRFGPGRLGRGQPPRGSKLTHQAIDRPPISGNLPVLTRRKRPSRGLSRGKAGKRAAIRIYESRFLQNQRLTTGTFGTSVTTRPSASGGRDKKRLPIAGEPPEGPSSLTVGRKKPTCSR